MEISNFNGSGRIRAILSSGYGRLHLAQSASWLDSIGVCVYLVCGWVPGSSNKWLVRLCSRIVGRNLSAGLQKRAIVLTTGGSLCKSTLCEFIYQGARIADKIICNGMLASEIQAWAWRLFGWHSKRFIKKYYVKHNMVFHVRSGAGQGGAIKLAKKLRIPVIVDHSIAHPKFLERQLREEYERNGATFDMGADSPFWKMIARDCEQSDCLIVNSHFVRDTFIEQGYPPQKIRVVYLGTREDFCGIRAVKASRCPDRKIRLLFTGNFGFRKGGEYILKAIGLLKRMSCIEFEMDVVGEYAGAKTIIEKYRSEGMPIVFHGPVPQDDLKVFLAESDIYVFPSLAEGCACSGMEAMAAGLCVVATHESGLPIDDGVNGCIVPSKDYESLAMTIMRLMKNPELIDKMGESAALLIKTKYTWDKYANNIMRIYKELLDDE